MNGTSQNFQKNGCADVVPLTIRASPVWSNSKDRASWTPPKVELGIFQLVSLRKYGIWMTTDECRELANEMIEAADTSDRNGKLPEPMF